MAPVKTKNPSFAGTLTCFFVQKESKVGSHPSCAGQPEAEETSSPVSLQGDFDWYLGEEQGAKIHHNGKVLNFAWPKKLTLS